MRITRKFLDMQGKGFAREILNKCKLCRRYERLSLSYPLVPPLIDINLKENYEFYTRIGW